MPIIIPDNVLTSIMSDISKISFHIDHKLVKYTNKFFNILFNVNNEISNNTETSSIRFSRSSFILTFSIAVDKRLERVVNVLKFSLVKAFFLVVASVIRPIFLLCTTKGTVMYDFSFPVKGTEFSVV